MWQKKCWGNWKVEQKDVLVMKEDVVYDANVCYWEYGHSIDATIYIGDEGLSILLYNVV